MIDLGSQILNVNINLHWEETKLEDLRDDIIENFDKHLYEFIDNNPERAFYTGCLLHEMLYDEKELETEQYLLYSREYRHVLDNLDKYSSQINYFQNEYKKLDKPMNKLDVYEYILNNMFYSNYLDFINLCIRFGSTINFE